MSQQSSFVVGIVGASGAVGVEMITCLNTQKFPVEKLRLFANRSAGKVVPTPFGDTVIEKYSVEAARECHLILLAVSGSFAKEEAPKITKDGGPVVIDNSSAWRYVDDVPLVVPEINGRAALGKRLIANPNCTTAIAAMVLWPIHQKYGLKRVIVSTYQAASGAGVEGMQELMAGIKQHLEGGSSQPVVFAHQLALNVIPHIDAFQENKYTKEEMKVVWETRKIFADASIDISCTAVRVPTMRAHAEAITIECARPVDPAEARQLLETAPGVKVVDRPADAVYPMPLVSSGKDDVEVGRIRRSLVFENGLDMFVCGDQLLRGAALNAVLIAKHVFVTSR